MTLFDFLDQDGFPFLLCYMILIIVAGMAFRRR